MSSIERAIERQQRAEQAGTAPADEAEEFPAGPMFETRTPATGAAGTGQQTKKSVQLDLAQLEKDGYLTPRSDRSKIAEEYRIIKRPLLVNAFGEEAGEIENGNLIMVTSSMPGEGKTFTVMNLAMSMAMERDTTVLVVDSDVLKPSLTALFGLQNEPGLTDVLAGTGLGLGDVIVNTDMPKLRVLPAGTARDNTTEMLASENMRRIARELSERYSDRVVLFDAPPLLVTTQARVLSDQVGQILMVVEAGRTSRHAVEDALSQLDKGKRIGMTLNKSRRSFTNEFSGSYGYASQ